MSFLGTALIQAAIALCQYLLKVEGGFISDEVAGILGEAQASLRALLDATIPMPQKEILWHQAISGIKAAALKFKDEAGTLPATAGSELFPILEGLLSVGFKELV
jgi:hypothetical protein